MWMTALTHFGARIYKPQYDMEHISVAVYMTGYIKQSVDTAALCTMYSTKAVLCVNMTQIYAITNT